MNHYFSGSLRLNFITTIRESFILGTCYPINRIYLSNSRHHGRFIKVKALQLPVESSWAWSVSATRRNARLVLHCCMTSLYIPAIHRWWRTSEVMPLRMMLSFSIVQKSCHWKPLFHLSIERQTRPQLRQRHVLPRRVYILHKRIKSKQYAIIQKQYKKLKKLVTEKSLGQWR